MTGVAPTKSQSSSGPRKDPRSGHSMSVKKHFPLRWSIRLRPSQRSSGPGKDLLTKHSPHAAGPHITTKSPGTRREGTRRRQTPGTVTQADRTTTSGTSRDGPHQGGSSKRAGSTTPVTCVRQCRSPAGPVRRAFARTNTHQRRVREVNDGDKTRRTASTQTPVIDRKKNLQIS